MLGTVVSVVNSFTVENKGPNRNVYLHWQGNQCRKKHHHRKISVKDWFIPLYMTTPRPEQCFPELVAEKAGSNAWAPGHLFSSSGGSLWWIFLNRTVTEGGTWVYRNKTKIRRILQRNRASSPAPKKKLTSKSSAEKLRSRLLWDTEKPNLEPAAKLLFMVTCLNHCDMICNNLNPDISRKPWKRLSDGFVSLLKEWLHTEAQNNYSHNLLNSAVLEHRTHILYRALFDILFFEHLKQALR